MDSGAINKQPSVIGTQLLELEKNIARLTAVIEGVEKRFSVVLSPQGPVAGENEKEPSLSIVFAELLHQKNRELEKNINRLGNIVERCEI